MLDLYTAKNVDPQASPTQKAPKFYKYLSFQLQESLTACMVDEMNVSSYLHPETDNSW